MSACTKRVRSPGSAARCRNADNTRCAYCRWKRRRRKIARGLDERHRLVWVVQEVRAELVGEQPAPGHAARRVSSRILATASGAEAPVLSMISLTLAAYMSTYSWPDSIISSYMSSSVIERSTKRSPDIP